MQHMSYLGDAETVDVDFLISETLDGDNGSSRGNQLSTLAEATAQVCNANINL